MTNGTITVQRTGLTSLNKPGYAPRLSAFASDLGLPVGRWPNTLAVVGPDGGVERFDRTREVLSDEGELQAMRYAGPNGQELAVFND